MTSRSRIRQTRPQVKICGLTIPKQALLCAKLGADAIGIVFYEKSPRYVTQKQAAEICRAVDGILATVGVFVDASYDTIMRVVDVCGLSGVQLHGKESPELVSRVVKNGIMVIKALYVNARPHMSQADAYPASAYLLECAGGRMPGGNALDWDWKEARAFGKEHPFILAGGIRPENVGQAIENGRPDAVDVSSGVESAAGKKDLRRVSRLISRVHESTIVNGCRRIFI